MMMEEFDPDVADPPLIDEGNDDDLVGWLPPQPLPQQDAAAAAEFAAILADVPAVAPVDGQPEEENEQQSGVGGVHFYTLLLIRAFFEAGVVEVNLKNLPGTLYASVMYIFPNLAYLE